MNGQPMPVRACPVMVTLDDGYGDHDDGDGDGFNCECLSSHCQLKRCSPTPNILQVMKRKIMMLLMKVDDGNLDQD